MKKILTAAVLIFGYSLMAGAQTEITNEKMSQDGKNVTVSFDLNTDKTNIPHQRKEVILPYIYNGKDTLYLDVVEVFGKGRFKRERQENALKGDMEWELSQKQVLKNEGIYRYESQVPLKRWMKSATLGVRRQIVGCACENDLEDENIAEASLFKEPTVQRRSPEYALEDAAKLWDFGQDELEIIFKVSKAEIDSTVFNNEVTFGKILAAVDKIFTNPHYRIDKIEVAGYASPEGPPEFNRWLGENRAKALINYIIEHRPQYKLTMDNFKIVNGEENWAGLERIVRESDMEYKDEVLAIIGDNRLTGEQKKLKIGELNYGWVWKKMLKEIYPQLRCARYLAIYYDSSDDKTIDIINQANAMIREGKYAEAEEHMKKAADDARGYNTTGVAVMMQGRFEEAMPLFQKAAEAGNQSALRNIETLDAEHKWEARMQSEIDEYLKSFE